MNNKCLLLLLFRMAPKPAIMSSLSVGGPLAVTDANLVLGRLIPDYFPHIFGESEDQPLDKARATAAFRTLTQQVCITMLKQLNSKHMIVTKRLFLVRTIYHLKHTRIIPL